MNELKSEDVMKALECCLLLQGATCRDCPLLYAKNMKGTCYTELKRQALALLREKDAEIERLSHHCDDCVGCTQWLCDCSNIRAEAINEFAEKLIGRFNVCDKAMYSQTTVHDVIAHIAKELKEKPNELPRKS